MGCALLAGGRDGGASRALRFNPGAIRLVESLWIGRKYDDHR